MNKQQSWFGLSFEVDGDRKIVIKIADFIIECVLF